MRVCDDRSRVVDLDCGLCCVASVASAIAKQG